MNLTRSSLTRALRIELSLNQIPKRVAVIGVFAFLLFCSSASLAQNLQLGIDFTTAFPKGDFKQNIDSNGYGVGGQVLFGIGRSPFLVGGDFNVVTYGSDEFKQRLSPTIPEVRVRVKTTNNIFMSHFVVRAQKREGQLRPYVEGLIGLKYLFTRTSVSNDFTGEEFAGDTNFDDTTFSYGVGGGVQVLLANTGGKRDILLDTKVRYLKGSEADYLREGSIIRDNGRVLFDPFRSKTDLLTLQIGVTFRF